MKQRIDEVIKILDTLNTSGIENDKIKTALTILKKEKNHADFLDIFQFSANPILIYCNNIITHVNEAALVLYGYNDSSELIGLPALETIIHKDDRTKILEYKETLNQEKVATIENVRHIHKSGLSMNTETHISKVIINNVPHTQVMPADTKQQLSLKHQTLEAKSLFENIFENSPDAIFIHNFEKIIDVNFKFLKLFAYSTKSQIIGNSPIENLVHPDDYKKVKDGRHSLVKNNTISFPEVRFLKRDKTVFYAEIYASVILINGDKHLQIVVRDLTERKKTKKKAEIFNQIIENSHNEVYILNPNVNLSFLEINNAAIKNLGYSLDEIQLIKPSDVISGINKRTLLKGIKNLTHEKNKVFIIQATHTRKDGSNYPVESHIQRIDIDDSYFLAVTAIDITEKQKKTLALLKSQEKYKGIVNTMIDVFVRVNHLAIIEMASPSIELIGYTNTEVQGKPVTDFYTNPAHAESFFIQVMKNGQVIDFETQLLTKERRTIDVMISGKIYIDSYGKQGIESVIKDVSDFKSQQNKLIENQNLLKTVNENSPDFITIINNDFEILYINRVGHGVAINDVIGANILNFAIQSKQEELIKHFESSFNGEKQHFEMELYKADGTLAYFSLRLSPIIEHNRINSLLITATDITESINQQRKISEDQTIFETINENSPDIIIFIDSNYKVVYINKILEGLVLEDVIHTDILNFVPEHFKPQYIEYLKLGFTGHKSDFEMESYGPNNTTSWYSVRFSPIIDNGDIKSLLITSTDITKRKKIETHNKLINSISQKINNRIDVISFCNFVFMELQKVKPFTDIHISSYDPISNKLSIIYQIKDGELVKELPEERIAGKELSEYIIGNEKGKILNNKSELLAFHNKNGLDFYGKKAKSWIGVPLISNNKTVGILASQNINTSNYYTESDLNLLSFIGTQLGSIIETEKTKKELIAQKERLTLATNSSKMGVYDWDIKSNTLIWDDVMYETFGVKKEAFTDNYEAWVNALHPDDVEKSQSAVNMALQGLKAFNTEFRIVLPDKSIRYIRGLGKVLRNKDNEPYRMVGLNWDISEQKRTALMTQGIADIQDSFITAEEPSESFEKMLSIILEITDSETGFIGEVQYQNGAPYLSTHTIINPSSYKEATLLDTYIPSEGMEFPNLKRLFAEVLSSGEAVIINNTSTENRNQGITNVHPKLSNFTGIPFYYKDLMIGVIGLANKPQGFILEDINKLRPFLTTCSTLIKAHQDTLKRNEAEEKLVVMADIVANSNDAIISTNTLGEIISWNNGAQKLLGYTAEEIIGKSIAQLRPKAINWERHKMVEEVQNGKVIEGFETIQIHKNGKQVNVDMSIFPLTDTEGNITGVSSILRDIEERIEITKIKEEFTTNLEEKVKERTIDLERAKKKLAVSLEKEKVLNDLKSKFVSTASHQFRTPLSVIQAGIGLLDLQKGDMSEKLQMSFDKTYKRITSQILKMTSLMDEVLTLGNITSGDKKASFKAVDLVMLCESTVSTYNDIQEDNRLMAVMVTGKRHPLQLDESLIEHAISNLISNSFKFSKGKESPTLIINFKDNETEVCITDFGIGIPQKDLAHFFDPFFRASNTEGISGTGLGTAIAKEYIELNNGTITVSSKLNIGTKFSITFKNEI